MAYGFRFSRGRQRKRKKPSLWLSPAVVASRRGLGHAAGGTSGAEVPAQRRAHGPGGHGFSLPGVRWGGEKTLGFPRVFWEFFSGFVLGFPLGCPLRFRVLFGFPGVSLDFPCFFGGSRFNWFPSVFSLGFPLVSPWFPLGFRWFLLRFPLSFSWFFSRFSCIPLAQRGRPVRGKQTA